MSAPDDLSAVIAAGRQSRTAFATELAAAFRHDPKTFDPRRLERLGAAGLRQFLGEVGARSRTMAPAPISRVAPGRVGTSVAAQVSGWRHLRRSEWPMWIAGVSAGLRAGIMVIGAGLFILLSAERIAPLVREFLR
jgi:hypothetical protein